MAKAAKIVMLRKGYSSYFAAQVPKMIMDDFINNKDMSLEQKLWAYRRGFFSSRVHVYGIDENNYKNHMPDFEYYKLHPLNGKYGSWIDDKLSMKYVLSKFNNYLPKYYFQLEEDETLRLMDCPDHIQPDIEGILQILRSDGGLALKPYSGTFGEGFFRLSYYDSTYYINTQASTLNEIKDLLSNLREYLVMEYIVSHDSIRKIYDVTPNPLRIQLIRQNNKEPKITGTFIKFGTSDSGILETLFAGGIRAGIDVNTGNIFDPYTILNNKIKRIKNHPDTNESMEIQLPHWEKIVGKIYEISDNLPQLTYIGFDVIITNEGFKVLEINSLTSIHGISHYYPYFADDYTRAYFIDKFEDRPDKFSRVLQMLYNN